MQGEGQRDSQEWRNLPATERQKAKLRFYGATWRGEITRGAASDATQTCMDAFPEKEDEWECLPVTPEQIQQLHQYGAVVDPNLTYTDAIKLITECQEEQAEEQVERLEHYLHSVNAEWASDYREATREEVLRAIAHLDETKPGWESTMDVLDALIALFPGYREKQGTPGFLTSYCGHCHGPINVKPPYKYDREITPADILFFTLKCPHCGGETSAYTLRDPQSK